MKSDENMKIDENQHHQSQRSMTEKRSQRWFAFSHVFRPNSEVVSVAGALSDTNRNVVPTLQHYAEEFVLRKVVSAREGVKCKVKGQWE